MEKLWYLAAVLVALLFALIMGIWGFAKAEDVATAIGPVVTAMATIGAAIFGITVGRESGKAEGREEGTAKGRKQVAAEVSAHLSAPASGRDVSDRLGDTRGGPVNGGGVPADSHIAALRAHMQHILDE